MATPKQAHALVSYFATKYKGKYGYAPKVNRYAARWGFDSLLMDMDVGEAESLIDYYFETMSLNGHALDWFFYNYDKLMISKEARDEDAAKLARIREETKKRTEEWRKKKSGNN